MEEQDLMQTAQELVANLQQQPPLGGAEGGAAQGGAPDAATNEGIPQDKFFAELQKYTGEEVRDPSLFKARWAASAQVPELQNRLRELELQTQQDPFASPLVKKLNELASKGAKEDELYQFMNMQRINPDVMDEKEARRHQLSYQHPSLSPQEVDALVEREFARDAENPDYALIAEQKMKGEEARKFLRELKVAAENPAAVQQRQMADAQAAKATEAWNMVLSSMLFSKDALGNPTPNFKSKFSHQFEDGTYEFDYAYKPETLQLVLKQLVSDAVRSGVPLTPEGVGQMREQAEIVLRAVEGAEMQKALVSDIAAKFKQAIMKAQSGPPPPPVRTATPVQQPGDGKPKNPDASALIGS